MTQSTLEWSEPVTDEATSTVPTSRPQRPHDRFNALPAIGILGLAGGWLAADYFRMGATASSAWSRGLLIGLATVTAVVVGALSVSRATFVRAAMTATAVTPTVGAVLGVVTLWLTGHGHQYARTDFGNAALDGLAAGCTFLPAVIAVLFANRHAGRARSGSVVDGVDRRAPYVAAAIAIALGAPLALHGSDDAPWLQVPVDVTLAASVLASISLLVAAVLDWRSFMKGRAAAAGWETLEPHGLDDDLAEGSELHDLGLGDTVLGRVERSFAYRGQSKITSRLRGEPVVAVATLQRATIRSGVAFILSVAAATLTFATAHRLADARYTSLSEDISHDIALTLGQTGPSHELEQLPLTCEAYFAMAGGCAERLRGEEREHVARELSDVRDGWVSHRSREAIEESCTKALRDALDHRACATESAAPKSSMRR